MRPARAESSDRYEKVEENVFRMKPLGAKPRRRILTPFGQGVLFTSIFFIVVVAVLYLMLR